MVLYAGRVTLRFSLRAAVSSTTDAYGRFAVLNLVWLLVVGLTFAGGQILLPGYLVGILLIPASCGLVRTTAHVARKDFPQYRHFLEGMRHHFAAHMGLGVAQGLLVAIALVNLGVGMGSASLLSALIAVVAAYVALATLIFSVAAWPLLLDPNREGMAVPTVLRLALAVAFKRPVSLLLIGLIELLLFAAVAEVVLLGLILPSFGALLAAHFVLPVADDLRARGPTAVARRQPVTPRRSRR